MEDGNFNYMLNTEIQRRRPIGVKTGARLHTSENIPISNDLQQQAEVFQVRFSRCRKLLYFLACRVLGSSDLAHHLVENCEITASRNPPRFEGEGAFRSWLVRILIDEALAIVRERTSEMTSLGTSPDLARR
jgi:DNA-directed RNA polymerase specialized sigma24 family protein